LLWGISSVADSLPAFHFDADPDPTFHSYADPEPTNHFFLDLDPPMLRNDPLGLPPFHFDANPHPDPDPAFHFDPDPAFYFYADLDPASQNPNSVAFSFDFYTTKPLWVGDLGTEIRNYYILFF
jgi:hypothetical protein